MRLLILLDATVADSTGLYQVRISAGPDARHRDRVYNRSEMWSV